MRKKYLILVGVIVFLLAACGQAAPPATSVGTNATSVSETSAAAAATEKVTLGLGYIPNVQFAPFYVAQDQGFYAEEGLDVAFSYGGNVNDLLLQSASGQLPFVLAAGDEILLARSQQVPVKMVFLLYQKLPVAVFSKASAGIAKPEDLRGKTIGIPGRYGATYIGLRGLLHAAGMQESDVNISEIGFTQFEAVSQDTVPAAVGYSNNEPLRLAEGGTPVNLMEVTDYIQLVNNGIVTSESFAAENPETVRRFVRATLRGLEATLADPDRAFEVSLKQIPELAPDQQPFQRKVLGATLGYWQTGETDREGLGWLNPPAWQTTYDFLRASGILAQETDPAAAYTSEFLK